MNLDARKLTVDTFRNNKPRRIDTVIEPGWHGYLTLEIASFVGRHWFPALCPIAQVIFQTLSRPVGGYDGKYQDQPAEPVAAILD